MCGALSGKTVLLGVTGGIAAYKSAEIVRGLMAAGADVHVVMTPSATRFITPLTFGTLSGNPVRTGLFDDAGDGRISHIELSAKADIVLVAPATANIIGKLAGGIADELLSTLLMAARCPVVVAPAMNCRMYESPAVARNIETLRSDGVCFVGPDEGPMACGETGYGRMSGPDVVVAEVVRIAAATTTLAGRKFVVSAGPTIEDIDPVRFIGNRSSGKMGYAVAAEALARGADVTLVSGPVSLTPPAGATIVQVRSAAQMFDTVMAESTDADCVVMAAAVADYTPAGTSVSKIKKGPDKISVELVRTKDVLAALGAIKKKGLFIAGFAAETDELDKNARKKLKEKGADLIAANPVGGDTGFGSEDNVLRIYGRDGLLRDTGRVSKRAVASVLMDEIVRLAGF